jgi:hypothetical protein
VRAYVDESPGVKTTDLLVDHRVPSERPAESVHGNNQLDQHPQNRSDYNGMPIPSLRGNVEVRTNQDIDSTGFDSLEEYAEKLSMNEETIVKWVNAGILSPHETEEAEKLIRILRLKGQKNHPINPHSSKSD